MNLLASPLLYTQIGAQKGGTTALSHLFSLHPNIVLPNRKEAHFFDWTWQPLAADIRDEEACRLRAKYRRLIFNEQAYQNLTNLGISPLFTFEKTPSYLYSPDVAARIHRVVGDNVKILASLRNPVDRLYSEYSALRHKGTASNLAEQFEMYVADKLEGLRSANLTTAPSFEDYRKDRNVSDDIFAIPPISFAKHRKIVLRSTEKKSNNRTKSVRRNSLQMGMYAHHLSEWMQHYELGKNLMVIHYEKFAANQREVFANISQFLGLPPVELNDTQLRQDYSPGRKVSMKKFHKHMAKLRKRGVIHRPKPMRDTTEFLLRFYKPYNDKLADLLGEDWRGIWDTTSLLAEE